MSPGTVPQLVILLLFVLPGSVYQATRVRYAGQNPEEQEIGTKIIRALAVSTFLHGVYLLLFGSALINALRPRPGKDALAGVAEHARAAGFYVLALLVLVPFALGWVAAHRRLARRGVLRVLLCLGWVAGRLRHPRHDDAAPRGLFLRAKAGLEALPVQARFDRTPTAWDWAADRVWGPGGFVRVYKKEVGWVGGAFENWSYISGYPFPPSVYVERAYQMKDDGEFGDEQQGTRGLWVSCDDALVVEFIAGVHEDTPEEEHTGT